MQTLTVTVAVDEDGLHIRLIPDTEGQTFLPELLAYGNLIAGLRMFLEATVGYPTVEESLESAQKFNELMETVIRERLLGSPKPIMLSGLAPDDELDALFDRHNGDQMAAAREILEEQIGASPTGMGIARTSDVSDAIERIAKQIMDGTLGQDNEVDAPGIPAPPLFTAN